MRTFSWRLNERIIVCSVPRNDGAEGSFGRMKMESVHPGHWEERTRDEVLVENVQGKGTFVMERGNELMKERARERIMDKLREVSIEAKAADISLLDLLGMFEKAYREQS